MYDYYWTAKQNMAAWPEKSYVYEVRKDLVIPLGEHRTNESNRADENVAAITEFTRTKVSVIRTCTPQRGGWSDLQSLGGARLRKEKPNLWIQRWRRLKEPNTHHTKRTRPRPVAKTTNTTRVHNSMTERNLSRNTIELFLWLTWQTTEIWRSVGVFEQFSNDTATLHPVAGDSTRD